MENVESSDRVKFFGPNDLANPLQAERAITLIQTSASHQHIQSLNDALELHNALLLKENSILPAPAEVQNQVDLGKLASEAKRKIAHFFAILSSEDLEQLSALLDYQYTDDLIALLERYNVGERVGRQILFEHLSKARIPVSSFLSNPQFVKRNNRILRDALLLDAQNGEILIRMHLLRNDDNNYTLPASFSPLDAKNLLTKYIDSESPHPNMVEAVAKAKDNPAIGVTAKVRLQARRRSNLLSKELLNDPSNSTSSIGYEIKLDSNQIEPVIDSVDRVPGRTVYTRSLSEQHLKRTLSPLFVIENFATTLRYMDEDGLLTLPSFRNNISAIRKILISGRHDYPRAMTFARVDCLTLQATHIYAGFLRFHGIEIEDVVSWFFSEYLAENFGAVGFRYAASSPSSSPLERCRHISAEMESISRQYTLYHQEGELDLELLRMTSAPNAWAELPSLVERKYLTLDPTSACSQALYLLFSDQSGLVYINKELRARSFVQLVAENRIHYGTFHPFQKNRIDWLISEGLIEVSNNVIDFVDPAQIFVLRDIYYREAASFGYYNSPLANASIELVQRGWLTFTSTLLTPAEASYFNFYLNKSEFSDGPDLRNRYAHGTNDDPSDTAAHQRSYTQLLRLMVSLVLKIREDFYLADNDKAPNEH